MSARIPSDINNFILKKKYQQNPPPQKNKEVHSLVPWFTPECAVAIAQYDHYYNLYHRENVGNLAAFRTVRNHCKSSRKRSYAQLIQTNVENKRLGSCEF